MSITALPAYCFNILLMVLRKNLYCFLILVVFAFPVVCNADDNGSMMDSIIKPQLEGSEIKSLKNLEESITDEAKELFPQYSPGKLMEELVRGNAGENIKSLPKAVVDTIIGEIKQNFGLLLKLIMIIFLTAMVKNLQSSFKEALLGNWLISPVTGDCNNACFRVSNSAAVRPGSAGHD